MTNKTSEFLSELLTDLESDLEFRLSKFPQDVSELIVFGTMRDIQLALHAAYERGREDVRKIMGEGERDRQE